MDVLRSHASQGGRMIADTMTGDVAPNGQQKNEVKCEPESKSDQELLTTSLMLGAETERNPRGPYVQATLSFHNIVYDCPGKRILHGISGGVKPGQLVAVMGASGSGKSTLLDILANRKIRGGKFTEGSIRINGRPSLSDRSDFVGYVAQDDLALLGGFTVRETFWFTARLIYGYRSIPSADLFSIVDEMILEMGLTSCADTRVGNVILRGISGGQKRRVSIGIALLARHPILLLDEPTSGLDSMAAFAIMNQLKHIAGIGHSLIATIHQPSSAIFSMFDSLILLNDGREIYFGKASEAVGYFETEFNAACPEFFNPADFLLDTISKEFSTLKQLQDLTPLEMATRFDASSFAEVLKEEFPNIASVEMEVSNSTTTTTTTTTTTVKRAKIVRASSIEQTCTLIHRGLLNLVKNPGLIGIRLVMYTILSVSIGLAFMGDKGKDNDQAIQALTAVVYFSPCLYLFMSCAVIPFYFEEKFVFFREHKNGLISLPSYVIAAVLSVIPGTLLLAIITQVITFYMVGLNDFGRVFLYWWAVFLLGEMSAMFFAMPFPHYMVSLVLCCGMWGSGILLEGYLILLSKMTWAVRWLSYSLPGRYIFCAAMRAQWENVGALQSPLFTSGAAILDYYECGSFGYQTFWVDWGIILVFALVFAGLFALSAYWMVAR